MALSLIFISVSIYLLTDAGVKLQSCIDLVNNIIRIISQLKCQNIYILGSGHFGKRAFKILRNRTKYTRVTVIDKQPQALAEIIAAGGHVLTMDAIKFLDIHVDNMSPDDWIVPAIPVHVAYAWLRLKMKTGFECHAISVPNTIQSRLPNPLEGQEKQVYASIATFTCPEDCPEPQTCCTVTGKPRPQILSETLTGLDRPDFRSICIVSSQLGPGVGGFQVKTLRQAVKDITKNPGRILLSTSCKCHAVLDAFHCKPKQER
jgi:TrkA family protein